MNGLGKSKVKFTLWYIRIGEKKKTDHADEIIDLIRELKSIFRRPTIEKN